MNRTVFVNAFEALERLLAAERACLDFLLARSAMVDAHAKTHSRISHVVGRDYTYTELPGPGADELAAQIDYARWSVETLTSVLRELRDARKAEPKPPETTASEPKEPSP